MSEEEPRSLWFSISTFWAVVGGLLLFTLVMGVFVSYTVNSIKPQLFATPTVTAPSEQVAAQRYRVTVATDTNSLNKDITAMESACAPAAAMKTNCLADLSLVHSWLIQYRSDLNDAQVPACYYIVNGQIRDALSAYLQAEQLVYTGESLDHQDDVMRGLGDFTRTTTSMDRTLVIEESMSC